MGASNPKMIKYDCQSSGIPSISVKSIIRCH